MKNFKTSGAIGAAPEAAISTLLIPNFLVIDLNEIFPQSDKDLNDLFPDEETKLLLKKMQKNKKDLHIMTDRFLEENWNSDAEEGFSGNGELETQNQI